MPALRYLIDPFRTWPSVAPSTKLLQDMNKHLEKRIAASILKVQVKLRIAWQKAIKWLYYPFYLLSQEINGVTLYVVASKYRLLEFFIRH